MGICHIYFFFPPCTGFRGQKGAKGDPGPDGWPGEQGSKGSSGAPGRTGRPGLPGPHGIKGFPGPRGYPGDTGDQVYSTIHLISFIDFEMTLCQIFSVCQLILFKWLLC